MSILVQTTSVRCLSVCIAAYKEEHSLPAVVASILASTIWASPDFDQKEILICLNGGDAATERVARALETEIASVRCLLVQEKGKILAVRRLISDSNSSAPILFFVDADVLLEPSALERLYACLCAEESVDLVGAFGVAVEEPLRKCGLYQYGYARLYNSAEYANARRAKAFVCGGCYAIRRRAAVLFSQQCPADPRIDDDKALNALTLQERLRLLADAHFYYRVPAFWDSVLAQGRHAAITRNLRLYYPAIYSGLCRHEPCGSNRLRTIGRFLRMPLWAKATFVLYVLSFILGKVVLYRRILLGGDIWPSVESAKRFAAPARASQSGG
jgi:glycosyltransferase involved in cell wall biosynthesis